MEFFREFWFEYRAFLKAVVAHTMTFGILMLLIEATGRFAEHLTADVPGILLIHRIGSMVSLGAVILSFVALVLLSLWYDFWKWHDDLRTSGAETRSRMFSPEVRREIPEMVESSLTNRSDGSP